MLEQNSQDQYSTLLVEPKIHPSALPANFLEEYSGTQGNFCFQLLDESAILLPAVREISLEEYNWRNWTISFPKVMITSKQSGVEVVLRIEVQAAREMWDWQLWSD